MANSKAARHAAIIDVVSNQRVASQRELQEQLASRGFTVNQATLSRDVRELRLAKVPAAGGDAYYSEVEGGEPTASLGRLLPALFVSAAGTDNLVVVRTVTGGAQPVAVAIDQEDWPELLGTIAGDDTVLLILKSGDTRTELTERLQNLAAS